MKSDNWTCGEPLDWIDSTTKWRLTANRLLFVIAVLMLHQTDTLAQL